MTAYGKWNHKPSLEHVRNDGNHTHSQYVVEMRRAVAEKKAARQKLLAEVRARRAKYRP